MVQLRQVVSVWGGQDMSKLGWFLSRIRRTLWVRVVLYAVLGVVAAIAASLATRYLPWSLPLDISSDAIDSLLTVISSSMLAVTTFSVGALTSAYAGATSNGTPRATTLLAEDPVVQSALATFVGSFVFSIVGLVALRISARAWRMPASSALAAMPSSMTSSASRAWPSCRYTRASRWRSHAGEQPG